VSVTTRLLLIIIVSLSTSIPSHAQAAENGGRALAAVIASADSLFRAKDFAGALAAYRLAVRQDSTNAGLWDGIGLSAAQLGAYASAAEAFERSAAIQPNPNAIYNAAAMRARLNQPDSAFSLLDRALKSGFRNVVLLQADDDLKSLHADPRFVALVRAASIPLTPCMNDQEFRRFDFWVGEWEVTTRGGTAVGKSSVQSIAGGCGLLENWSAGNGATGKSINTYDATAKQWVQFWVGQAGGLVHYAESEWKDGAVTFVSRPASPKAAFQRLTFTQLSDGGVLQLGELSTDGGSSWRVGYDFYYHRKQ